MSLANRQGRVLQIFIARLDAELKIMLADTSEKDLLKSAKALDALFQFASYMYPPDDIHAFALDFCKSSKQLVSACQQLLLLDCTELQGILQVVLVSRILLGLNHQFITKVTRPIALHNACVNLICTRANNNHSSAQLT